jgi:hypothetical protein
MSRSRQVKNADQILRRLVSTLEYPYAMQQTLSQGDYEGVLNIYRRVQSLPATSGLRILKRVSSRADAIVADMKQKIVSTLLAPAPVFSVLSRLVKLIRELEDQDGCRNILQQCFDKQMGTFEDSVRSVGMKFSESLLRAYMRGQEINMMNKDKNLIDDERGIVEAASRSVRPVASNAPSRQQRRSQIMEALNVYDSDSASVKSDSSSHIAGSENHRTLLIDNYDEEDMDYRTRGDLESDAGSVHSNDTSNSDRERQKGGRGMDEEWLNDPDVDYSEVLCAKVRARTCRSLIEIIDMWLPSVNRVLQVLTSAPSGAGGGMAAHSSQGALKSALNVANTGTPKKVTIGTPSAAATSTANLSRALNTTYGRNQSIAGPAKQLGDCLVSCADIMRGAALGFKSKTTAPIMVEITNKGIFSQDMMQNALRDPFLTSTVTEVSELFDVIETMLTGRVRSSRLDNADEFDNINFFGSAAYRGSIITLRALAEDGESCVVKKSLEHLIASCLRHLSSSLSGVGGGSTAGSDLGVDAGGDQSRSGDPNKQLTADELIFAFENTVVLCLNRLSDIVRRPEWVASTVWESIQRLLDRYIATLGVSATNASLAGAAESPTKASMASSARETTVKFAVEDVSSRRLSLC